VTVKLPLMNTSPVKVAATLLMAAVLAAMKAGTPACLPIATIPVPVVDSPCTPMPLLEDEP
jgi:hypothetical protein